MNSCIICKKSGIVNGESVHSLIERGLITIIDASKIRVDNIHVDIDSQKTEENVVFFCHEKCRKKYTCKITLAKIIERNSKLPKAPEREYLTRRKNYDPFDYPTHCIICAKRAEFEKFLKSPSDYPRVCKVVLVDATKKSLVQQSIVKACEERDDELSIMVRARIEFASDLRAVDAVYHHGCLASFTSTRNIKCAGNY